MNNEINVAYKKYAFLVLLMDILIVGTVFFAGLYFERFWIYNEKNYNEEIYSDLEDLKTERIWLENELIRYLESNEHEQLYYSTAKVIYENKNLFHRQDILINLNGVDKGKYTNAIDRNKYYTGDKELIGKISDFNDAFSKIIIRNNDDADAEEDLFYRIKKELDLIKDVYIYSKSEIEKDNFINNQNLVEDNIFKTLEKQSLLEQFEEDKKHYLHLSLLLLVLVFTFYVSKFIFNEVKRKYENIINTL